MVSLKKWWQNNWAQDKDPSNGEAPVWNSVTQRWEPTAVAAGSSLDFVPVADSSGTTIVNKANPVVGAGTMRVLDFPADTAAIAFLLAGDVFPRFILTADGRLSVGDGTHNPYSADSAQMYRYPGGAPGMQLALDPGLGNYTVIMSSPNGTDVGYFFASDGATELDLETTDGSHVHVQAGAGYTNIEILASPTQVDNPLFVVRNSDNSEIFRINTARIGLYGVTPAARAAAYTQTYATAARVNPAATALAVATTPAALVSYGYTQAQADAIPVAINALEADLLAMKKLVNALIDDSQAIGISQ